ncbi:hypothetical protein QBC40DRAFT_226879 [Triangularia verruculosa]|uniref:Uncharacterized protein n=1 Tax=Triangularia verruculosa TaxID=2587418 RepID=A0AAN6XHY4_9PEZI|nr:hypothetical protein QBC40DRAFT_226879 [Triangularia verruculosa]
MTSTTFPAGTPSSPHNFPLRTGPSSTQTATLPSARKSTPLSSPVTPRSNNIITQTFRDSAKRPVSLNDLPTRNGPPPNLRNSSAYTSPEDDSASWTGDSSTSSFGDEDLPPPPPPAPPPPPRSVKPEVVHPVPPANLLPAGHLRAAQAMSGMGVAAHISSRQYPPDFDESASESSDSEDASTSRYHDRMRRDLGATVEDKQHEVRQLRSRMTARLDEMLEIIRKATALENDSMRLLRPDQGGIQKFRQLQAAQVEFFSVFKAMKAELKEDESQLQRLESDLVRAARPAPFSGRPEPVGLPGIDPILSHSITDEARDERPEILLGISGERYEDIHPRYQDLLDKVGDRELAREHCDEIKYRREDIIYDLEIKLHRKRMQENPGNSISEKELKEMKTSLDNIPTNPGEFEARFGLPANEDDLNFLEDYNCELQRAQKKFNKAEQEVHRLRKWCIDNKVMRKHASYNEVMTIHLGSDQPPLPPNDGNMAIEFVPRNGHSRLAHNRFPILMSNPSHVLDELSEQAALDKAMALPAGSPESAQRRAECMKELGITKLLQNAKNTPDFINRWLIHRLRTCPMEIELMLAVFETSYKVVNLRRWQEEVLFYWPRDEAAKKSPLDFDGPRTPVDEMDLGEHDFSRVNSDINRSHDGDAQSRHSSRRSSGGQSDEGFSSS